MKSSVVLSTTKEILSSQAPKIIPAESGLTMITISSIEVYFFIKSFYNPVYKYYKMRVILNL